MPPDTDDKVLSPFELAPEMIDDAWVRQQVIEFRRQEALNDAAEKRSEAAVKAREGEPYEAPVEPPASLADRLAAEQLITLKRSPTDWAPRTVTIGSTGVVQLAGRRPFRTTIVLFAASAAVTIARTEQDLEGDNNNVVIGNTGISSLSMDTEGPVYCTAAVGTTIAVLETFYDNGQLEVALGMLKAAIASGQVKQGIT